GLEQRTRVLVAAMLTPHHGKNPQLGVSWLAIAQNGLGVGVFFRRQVVPGNQFGRNGRFGHCDNSLGAVEGPSTRQKIEFHPARKEWAFRWRETSKSREPFRSVVRLFYPARQKCSE